jgi:TetR/AcrR family transcriptional repressor of nem operon
MRMSQKEKDRSHARIVASAARLFRERGLEGASVGEVMCDAGLTHGGFYKHFESKGALVETAIEEAFQGFVQMLADGDAQKSYAAYRALYLSEDHLKHPEIGCPIATLGQEVSRRPESLRAVFGAGVQRLVGAIARSMGGTVHARRKAAIRELSMMVGAMVIARASDDETASEVLSACRRSARHA